ncbi:MAG: helix-turn-helix domain-containing protein [Alphaproteobacteria bacterium]
MCRYQFTKFAPAGKPIFIKLISHSLYIAGLSMREIADIVGVTAQSISRWIKKWHPAYLSEIGSKETFVTADKETLIQRLNVREEEHLLVFSMPLPSGTKFNIVIQLPPDHKPLKK